MTIDQRRGDPGHEHADHDHEHDHEHDVGRTEETRVVERQSWAEPQQPVSGGYVPPAQPAGQVNVSTGGRSYVEPVRGPLYFARRVLSLLWGILAVLLAIRIIMLALVANAANEIVDFVYNVTEPFVAPFRGIFAFETVTPGGGSVFDIAAVVAFVGWLLIYLLLMAILSLADRNTA